MTIEQALLVLEIKSEKPTLQDIKNQYRLLAKRYHPDLSKDTNTTEDFILINAAYELLVKKRFFADYSRDFENTFDEDEVLNYRINAIKSELRNAHNNYNSLFTKEWGDLQNNLFTRINHYNSKNSLREHIQAYFQNRVENSIINLIAWYNNQIDSIVKEYNDWIFAFMDKTSIKLKKEELRLFYYSKSFISIFVSNLSIAILIMYILGDTSFFREYKIYFFILLPLLVLSLTAISFFSVLESKYTKEKFLINENAFHLTPQMLNFESLESQNLPQITSGNIAHSAARVGALSGQFGLGMLTAIGGALYNGAVSIWNSIMDDSLETLKQKAKNQCHNNLQLVENMITKNLKIQLDQINEKLIDNVTHSYNKAKKTLIKGYLQKSSQKLIENTFIN